MIKHPASHGYIDDDDDDWEENSTISSSESGWLTQSQHEDSSLSDTTSYNDSSSNTNLFHTESSTTNTYDSILSSNIVRSNDSLHGSNGSGLSNVSNDYTIKSSDSTTLYTNDYHTNSEMSHSNNISNADYDINKSIPILGYIHLLTLLPLLLTTLLTYFNYLTLLTLLTLLPRQKIL